MANPLSANKLEAALRAEGCKVREYRSWRTHNRDAETGRTFGPVNGLVIHHTAGRDSLALVYNGRSDLPGPLAHAHLAKDGTLSLTGHGRANHAGTFARNAHNAVVAESSTHPRPDSSEPIDGNDHYYGLEIENLGNGSDPYPAVQYDQAVRWAAAHCRAHGWTEHSVIGHKEGTRRKIDPTFDMNKFRRNVAERLDHSPSWNPTEDDDMPLTDSDINKIASRVWGKDGLIKNPMSPPSTNTHLAPATSLRNIEIVVRRLEKTVNAQAATISELVNTVAALASGTADATAIDPDSLVTRIKQAIDEAGEQDTAEAES